jgi:hypothetical protein
MPHRILTDEQVRGQLAELTKLSRLQTKALEDSSFVGMSNEERADYDKRRLRICELCESITKYKPKGPS